MPTASRAPKIGCQTCVVDSQPCTNHQQGTQRDVPLLDGCFLAGRLHVHRCGSASSIQAHVRACAPLPLARRPLAQVCFEVPSRACAGACACSRRDFICWIPSNSIIVCIFYRIMSKLMVDFTGEDERKRFAMLLPTTARRVHLFDGAFGVCCSLGSHSSCARDACACSLHLWMCQLLHGESHLHVQG